MRSYTVAKGGRGKGGREGSGAEYLSSAPPAPSPGRALAGGAPWTETGEPQAQLGTERQPPSAREAIASRRPRRR